MITKPVYATREDIRTVLGLNSLARYNQALDRNLEAGTEAVDACTRRTFVPVEATRYRDWPHPQSPTTWRLWLDDDLASLTSVTSGGVTALYSAGHLFLYSGSGVAPFRRLEIDRNSSFAFSGSSSTQRAVAIAGVWGHDDRHRAGGTVAEVLDTSETEVQVSSAEGVGVGDLIRVDSERMLVTDRAFLSTGLTVAAPGLSNGNSGTALVVSGAGLVAGELILVDSERMLVEDVVGTAATVRRAQDGSVLAAHTAGTTISAQRSLTVVRGAQGSVAATHLINASFEVKVYPGSVRTLAIAEALNGLASESSAWARVIGASEYAREATGSGLAALHKKVRLAYGIRARTAAV